MGRKHVQVGRDHATSLTRSTPLKAIEELIWNGLDAGGRGVEVRLVGGGLGAVDSIEVVDHGAGLPLVDLDQAFGQIGDSAKPDRKVNADGRSLHGSAGRGRFKALALGPTAIWETTFKEGSDFKTYKVTIRREEADFFDDTPPTPAAHARTGTVVFIPEVDHGQHSLLTDETRRRLTETFAPYLAAYPNVTITFGGRALNPDELVKDRKEWALLDAYGKETGASLLVLEWNFKPDERRLHICDERGFPYHEVSARVQGRGIEYTAYLRSPKTREWAENGRFASGELDEEITALIDSAREALRTHIRERLAEQASSIVDEWKRQEIYPYREGEIDTPLAQAEREVFDIVALHVHEEHPTFEHADIENKKLTLALIRQALETSPSSLTKILHEIISLSKEDHEALVDLLARAPLSNLIRAGRLVVDRLDLIQSFEHIVFDPNWKARLLERTQLHRLLVHELWILGEEYRLGTDDEGMRAVLQKHLELLGRAEIAPTVDVKLIDGKEGVPDLMLFRRRLLNDDHFEHVVVELKRPKEQLGQAELSQLEKYAFTVANDERFDTKKCRWTFILIGNSFDSFAKERALSQKLPEGCIHEGRGFSVWIRTWAEVFATTKARHEFIRDQLSVEASTERGMARLAARHGHLLQGRGVRKKKDLQITESKRLGVPTHLPSGTSTQKK